MAAAEQCSLQLHCPGFHSGISAAQARVAFHSGISAAQFRVASFSGILAAQARVAFCYHPGQAGRHVQHISAHKAVPLIIFLRILKRACVPCRR